MSIDVKVANQKAALQGAGTLNLKAFLDTKVSQYNRPEFIANDPSYVHKKK
jgi:hypothetical protein